MKRYIINIGKQGYFRTQIVKPVGVLYYVLEENSIVYAVSERGKVLEDITNLTDTERIDENVKGGIWLSFKTIKEMQVHLFKLGLDNSLRKSK